MMGLRGAWFPSNPPTGCLVTQKLRCVELIASPSSGRKLWECRSPNQRRQSLCVVRCSGDEAVGSPIPVPKYNSYIDPISGEPAPAIGNRTCLPDAPFAGKDMVRIRRMAQASVPEKVDKSTKQQRGKRAPGSRRRKFADDSEGFPSSSQNGEKAAVSASTDIQMDWDATKKSEEMSAQVQLDEDDGDEDEFRDEYVTYAPEEQDKEIDDITFGAPHAFVQEKQEEHALTLAEKPLSDDQLWWNWRKFPPGKEPWSAWHKRTGDSDSVMAAAMAEIGQIKLFGDKPTCAEAALARARKFVFYKERLAKEKERREEIGPMAYYQEWVMAWKNDTSKEAVQKHFEETGEDVSVQLLTMFQHQTHEEYKHMMGTDVRIQRDPLTMRMREEQMKQVWGGDPVYPTVNYIQDPDAVIDYRGPNFHEPVPDILDGLRKAGRLVTKEEIRRIQEEEKASLEDDDINDALDEAIDISEEVRDDDDGDGDGDDDDDDDDDGDDASHPWRMFGSITNKNEKNASGPL